MAPRRCARREEWTRNAELVALASSSDPKDRRSLGVRPHKVWTGTAVFRKKGRGFPIEPERRPGGGSRYLPSKISIPPSIRIEEVSMPPASPLLGGGGPWGCSPLVFLPPGRHQGEGLSSDVSPRGGVKFRCKSKGRDPGPTPFPFHSIGSSIGSARHGAAQAPPDGAGMHVVDAGRGQGGAGADGSARAGVEARETAAKPARRRTPGPGASAWTRRRAAGFGRRERRRCVDRLRQRSQKCAWESIGTEARVAIARAART